MEFQQFFDPFGSALQGAGMRLKNEATDLHNQNALLDLGLKKEQMEDEKKSRAMTMAAWGNKPVPGSQGAMALMGLEGAKPAEGTAEGEEGGTRTASGGTRDPYTGLMATYSRDRDTNLQQAQAAYVGHHYAEAEKYSRAAETATKNYGEALEKRTEYHKAVMSDLNRTFSNVNDGESLGTAVQEMQALHPEWDPQSLKQFGIKFDRGVPVFDKKKVDNMAQMALTIKDKAEIAYKAAEVKIKEHTAQIAEQRERAYERRTDQMAATHRDAVSDKADKRQEAFVEKEKKSLHAEPAVKDWDKYETAMSSAVTARDLLNSKGGYQAFTTSDAATLVRAANNMMQGFRSRYAGTHEMEQMNKLNGGIRSMEKWATTIGEGEKQVAFETAKEMVTAMQGIYDQRNVVVTRETLKRTQEVVRKGGDPDALEGKGDLKDLVSKGLARPLHENGKVYILLQNPVTRKFTEKYLIQGEDQ